MRVQHFLLTGIAVAVLSACGSDNNSKTVPETKPEPAKTVTKTGKVIGNMHNVDGAVAWVDSNNNHVLDSTEQSAPLEDGSFTITMSEEQSADPMRVKVPKSNHHYILETHKNSLTYSCATTLAHYIAHTSGKDEAAESTIEYSNEQTQTVLNMSAAVDLDYEPVLADPNASDDNKLIAKDAKLSNQASCMIQQKYMKAGLDKIEDEEFKDFHHASLESIKSEPGQKAILEMKKVYEPFITTIDMEEESLSDLIDSMMAFDSKEVHKQAALSAARENAVAGNAAEYFSTDGLITLGVGDPEDDEHAPSLSQTFYDSEARETFLTNYYYDFDHETYTGHFRTTHRPELEDHFVFNTTDREFKKSYHKWNVKDINLETGAITLINPWNQFVSRSPKSTVIDVSDVYIEAFLSENPDLKRSWGHLVRDHAKFAPGSKINKLTVTNNNQVFVLPETDECKSSDGDVKYAIVSDDNGEKKLCNFIYKHVNGEKSQARTFNEIFVDRFADLSSPDHDGVDGVIVAMDGSSYIIAQLKRAAGTDQRGDVKFFKESYVLNEDSEFEERISVFHTSTPTVWESQKFGTGENAVDLCRITLPKEVAGFGREVQMHKKAFVVELGEGDARALRHGKVLDAGLVLPKMPKGLNSVALLSIQENIDSEKYKRHEHEEFDVDKKCHTSNSLIIDESTKKAHGETMKTLEEFYVAAKNCTSYGEEVSTVSTFSEKILTVTKHDNDPYRKYEFSAADGNSGTVTIYKEISSDSETFKIYSNGTYEFLEEKEVIKVTYIRLEDNTTRHVYFKRIKSVENEAGNVDKYHLKSFYVIGDATKGVIDTQVSHVSPVPPVE